MQTPLTQYGQQAVEDLARRYGVSTDAVVHLLYAVMQGNGSMAQFSHPDLGGSGQWMRGGMTMVGDMFNNGLKFTVDSLCGELSNLLARDQPLFTPSAPPVVGGMSPGFQSAAHWWPSELNLGVPASTGAQNSVRYAWFPGSARLAVDMNGHIVVYDTLDHQIGGVSQQQGGNSSLSFSSQYGTVAIENLPVVYPQNTSREPSPYANQNTDTSQKNSPSSGNNANTGADKSASADAGFNANPGAGNNHQGADIFALIEKLSDLKQKGVLTEEEYATKKAELLQRL